jgi:hypothetical protein
LFEIIVVTKVLKVFEVAAAALMQAMEVRPEAVAKFPAAVAKVLAAAVVA